MNATALFEEFKGNIKEVAEVYNFMNKANDVAKKMAANYQLKKSAFERKNESFRASGSLNLSRLPNYKTSDEIFHNKVMTRQASNHGVIIIVDFSQSMQDMLYSVAQQFLVTALYCKTAKISFEAYGFTSSGGYSDNLRLTHLSDSSAKVSEIKEAYLRIMAYFFVNDYSMRHSEYMDKFRSQIKDLNLTAFMHNMSGTPLHAVTIQAYHRAMNMKNSGIENVSIVMITDGEANDGDRHAIIRDSYSNMFINNDENCIDNNNYIAAMNKLIRMQNIKIFNIFMMQTDMLTDGAIDRLGRYYREYKMNDEIPVGKLKTELTKDLGKEPALHMLNFCGYNSFVAIPAQVKFGQSTDTTDIGAQMKAIAKFSFVGKYLNELVCEDFA